MNTVRALALGTAPLSAGGGAWARNVNKVIGILMQRMPSRRGQPVKSV